MRKTFEFDLDGYPDQTMRVVLDSETYEIRFQWNERDESYMMSIGDVGADPTVTVKVTAFVDLLAPYKYLDNLPKGTLMVFSFTAPTERVGRFNVGPKKSVQLLYGSRDEDVEETEEE